VEEPPQDDSRDHNQQPIHLVAAKCAPLLIALCLFGRLLEKRLDARLDHRLLPPHGKCPWNFSETALE